MSCYFTSLLPPVASLGRVTLNVAVVSVCDSVTGGVLSQPCLVEKQAQGRSSWQLPCHTAPCIFRGSFEF